MTEQFDARKDLCKTCNGWVEGFKQYKIEDMKIFCKDNDIGKICKYRSRTQNAVQQMYECFDPAARNTLIFIKQYKN